MPMCGFSSRSNSSSVLGSLSSSLRECGIFEGHEVFEGRRLCWWAPLSPTLELRSQAAGVDFAHNCVVLRQGMLDD